MPIRHTSPRLSGGFRVAGGDHTPRPGDRDPALGREDANGEIWFTVRQAAAFVGCDRQTIYSWERRGHLQAPQRDEHGRRIYSQQQIAAAVRTTRRNTAAVRRIA
ncbi:MerR family DNA-binding transcriptional regulator [Streptomyces sp. NBC_00444]|uniref:MerR family transcriptional regulator n=1 Tax=Streptomyces sp. NBC_00444 TaxID=2975744 RepID=UPI002E1AECB2